jgi:D-xylose 1-dehydrogenase (NADP+, D-xylono-1,5-lactone-forming)
VAKVRWGLLTTARINEAIIDGVGRSDVAEIVAVASRDRERAEAYARDRAIERAHGSYDELLADPDVEVVYVALPSSLHVEWSIRALEAGKHVLCEKPMSRDPLAVEHAFDVAERNDRLLMEAFMYRHQPQAKRLRELVQEGAIGEPRLVRAAFAFPLDRPNDVRWDPELGGGALLDLGCYCVSGSRLVAGEPESVFAQRVLAPAGADVRFAATLRFPNDVLGQFDCGFDLPPRRVLEVVGGDGSLVLEPAFASDEGVLELRRGDEVEEIELPRTHRYQLQIENFSRAVRGEEAPLLDRRESVEQARALEALHRSSQTGTPVRLVELSTIPN